MYNPLRSIKITWKLTLLYASIFSLVLVLLNASVLYGIKFYLLGQASQNLENTSHIIASKITDAYEHQQSIAVPTLLEELHLESSMNMRLYNESGLLIQSIDNFTWPDYPINTINRPRIERLEIDEGHFVINTRLIQSDGKPIAQLQLCTSLYHEYAFLKILFAFLAVADLVGVSSSLIIGYLVSRKMLHPIDKITKTAQSISVNNLGQRIVVREVDDELSRLGKTFNAMVDRLEHAFEKQSQFVSDASHELRTPIAVIQGYIGLLDRWGKEDPAVLQESIDAIKLETSDMTLLIEKLLFIARGESGNHQLEKLEFDLADLLQEIVTESRIIAPTRLINCQTSSTPLVADRKLFKQMIRALVDNSIKFTNENGRIHLETSTNAQILRIIVSDDGLGIPSNELESIFDRFYQVDKARSQHAGGSGLGLPIVKWIANVHSGRVWAENNLGGGTQITLEFPLNRILM